MEPWADEPIEVELTGSTASDARLPHRERSGERPTSRAGGVVAGLAVAALAIVAVVSVVAWPDDGEEPESSATTVPADSTSLFSGELLPLPATTTSEPPPTTTPAEPPAALRPTEYEANPTQDFAAGAFDPFVAFERWAEDRSLRTTTEVFAGAGRELRFATDAARDVAQDRYLIATLVGDTESQLIIDVAEGTTFQTINAAETSWFELSLDDLESGLGRSAEELAREILDGPIDSAWYGTQNLRAEALVVLPDGTVARRLVMTVDPTLVADRFTAETVLERIERSVGFHIYVTGANDIVRIEGTVFDGREWLLVVHQVEPLSPEAGRIDLPDPALVASRRNTTSTSTTPSTSTSAPNG